MPSDSTTLPTRQRAQPPTLWRNLALILGATTVALVVFLVRVSDALETLSAAASRPAPAAVGEVTSLPPDLLPYAALGSEIGATSRLADLGWTPAQIAAFAEGVRLSGEGRGVPMNKEALRLRAEIERRRTSGSGGS